MSNTTIITAEPGQPILRVERVFNAPRPAVFDIFSKVENLEKWWNPYGPAKVEADIREGGAWKFDGGENATFYGYYHEVTAPERIVQTSEYASLPERGHVVLDRYEFTEQPDGATLVVLTEVYMSTEDRDQATASGMTDGIEETYKKIDKLLEEVK